jgi:hypothetical protein
LSAIDRRSRRRIGRPRGPRRPYIRKKAAWVPTERKETTKVEAGPPFLKLSKELSVTKKRRMMA